MISIIYEENKWDQTLKEIGSFDFYHTYTHHYHNGNEQDKPVLFLYEKGTQKVAFPFLKREINPNLFDLTSVHGKVGPIANIDESRFDNAEFARELEAAFKREKIVSAFSKLNSFLPYQSMLLEGVGDVVMTGENIYFDLTTSEEEQHDEYSHSTRQNIRKANKIAYLREVQNEAELAHFVKMHHAHLDRINAEKSYYFPKDWYSSLLNHELVEGRMFFAIHKETGDIMSGGFYVRAGGIVEDEIGWVDPQYRKKNPVALLRDEIRKIFKREGAQIINMGGGPGGREGNVMQAKQRYTKRFIDFNVWKHIVDIDTYEALCSQEQINSDSGYFPKYRITT